MNHKEGTIKWELLNLLRDGNFLAGGVLEDCIRQTYGNKASNVSRRLRELENEGVVEKEYRDVPHTTNKVVFYRLVASNQSVQIRHEVLAKRLQQSLL